MKFETKIFVFILITIFILGVFVCLNPNTNSETMSNMMNGEHLEEVQPQYCPNLLIQHGNKLHLINTQKPKDNTNPVIFDNLEQYLSYIQEERKRGVRCPIMYLQEEQNTQGETVYRMRPSPTNLAPGASVEAVEITDGARDRPPYNKNQFAGFDPYGQHIGQYTELDRIHDSTREVKTSDNPMDTNWGGVLFSQYAVDSGKYANREVGKAKMVPKVREIYK
jgi:hypothetical protein